MEFLQVLFDYFLYSAILLSFLGLTLSIIHPPRCFSLSIALKPTVYSYFGELKFTDRPERSEEEWNKQAAYISKIVLRSSYHARVRETSPVPRQTEVKQQRGK